MYAIYALAGALLIAVVGFAIVLSNISRRLKKLTTGTNGKNLEDAIYQLMHDHEIFEGRVESVEEKNARIDREIKSSVRGIATVRYNAFADVGGRQSFATALLSEDGTGVVISSIYSRDRMNVYAKPVANFSSEYELSNEEAHALKEAAKIFE
ncbi:MAG: hypothetical protein JWM20_581 [Patescibacteria group bacterium]|nr:hypothetical protein [Patescibacteria group bacterium]